MPHLVYFDNSIIRTLSENPSVWDKYVKIFGCNIRPVYSYYLFMEYIGFNKIKKKYITKPTETMLDFCNTGINKKDAKQAEIISRELENYFENACKHLLERLVSTEVQISFGESIRARAEYIGFYEFSQDLNKALFQDILDLLNSKYLVFAEILSTYLAWDYFCNVLPKGIDIKLLRQVQLGIWVNLWEQGHHFPFGKIIDDFQNYYDLRLSKNSGFKNAEDMVDAEVLTYSIMGLPNHKNEPEAVNIFTYDNSLNIEERIILGLSNLKNIQDTLKRRINTRFGKIYCLDKFTNEIQNVFEPQM